MPIDQSHYSAVVNIRMCKQILLDLEHGFIHKAKEARHIRIVVEIKVDIFLSRQTIDFA